MKLIQVDRLLVRLIRSESKKPKSSEGFGLSSLYQVGPQSELHTKGKLAPGLRLVPKKLKVQ